MAIAQGKQSIGSANHQAEGAAAACSRLTNRLIPIQTTIDSLLQSKRNQLRIGGGGEFTGDIGQRFPQFAGVHQIAVVGQGKRSTAGHQHHRLGIANLAAARRRIAVVANGQMARHALQHLLVKHLAHQAHVLVEAHLVLGIKHSDAGRFLAAVLQGVQAEIGEVGHGLIPGQDGVDAAGFLGLVGTLVDHRPLR